MKVRIITLIMLLASSLTISAQQKKVAVYVTGEDSGVNKVLGDQLVAGFARSGKYVAIERTASFLAELGKEHSYQRSGAVSDNQIAALGVQFGVSYVCVADVSEVFGEKYISARLIDVETAEVVNTHNVSGDMNSMNKCLQMANEITGYLTKGTFAEQEQERKAEQERKIAERRMQLKAQGLVDLGLPSGTLWKVENEKGGPYTYEQAVSKFGNKLPNRAQLEELKNTCKWIWEGHGLKVIGPSGEFIVLPAEWYSLPQFDGKRVYHDGSKENMGHYWSYTRIDSKKAYCILIGPRGGITLYDAFSDEGLSVRLVQKP